MGHYTIAPDETVSLNLPSKEHRALAECSLEACAELQQRARDTADGSAIRYTLEEFESLDDALAALIPRCDGQQKKLLKKVARRIERILDEYADPNPPDDYDYEDDVPEEFLGVYGDIVERTDWFCDEKLNDEYRDLCRQMAVDLCQPGSPVVRGKREGWACGIVYSVGWVNFLTDPDSTPYVRADDIAGAFGVSVATMHSKARVLREGLDLVRLAPEYTLPSLTDENPFNWIVEVGGLLIDMRNAPPGIQEAAAEAGLIPYVYTDEASDAYADGEPEGDYAIVYERASASGDREENGPMPTDQAYEIKITLRDSKPPIWRRVRVPDCTLEDLHDVIQAAMGWDDCHLHEFRVGDERYGPSDDDDFGFDDEPPSDEGLSLLSDLVKDGRKQLEYWYDFGDGWRHTVKFEKTLARQSDDEIPVCVAGARACPPEDIGGVWGYAEFLEALADKQHPQHEDYMDWCGGEFDPEEFDIEYANEELAELFDPEDDD